MAALQSLAVGENKKKKQCLRLLHCFWQCLAIFGLLVTEGREGNTSSSFTPLSPSLPIRDPKSLSWMNVIVVIDLKVNLQDQASCLCNALISVSLLDYRKDLDFIKNIKARLIDYHK